MLFNGANWKMNSFREHFASQSCQNEEISHLFFCSDSKFISAPAKIMKQADLVLITFASEEETFRNLILQKGICGNYRDILWPESIACFEGFGELYKSLYASV
jgi:ethanolamine ammonia-lyase large subunit